MNKKFFDDILDTLTELFEINRDIVKEKRKISIKINLKKYLHIHTHIDSQTSGDEI